MTDQRRWDHQYADVVIVQQSTTMNIQQELPEDHNKALAVLCRVCARRCVKHGKKINPRPAYRHASHLLSIFKIDVAKDKTSIHPQNLCLSCLSAKQNARPRTEWTPHGDGTECTACQIYLSSLKGGRRLKPANIALKHRREREKAGYGDDTEGPEAKRRKEALMKEVMFIREPILREAKLQKEAEAVEAKRRKEAELVEAKRRKEAELVEANCRNEVEIVAVKLRKEDEGKRSQQHDASQHVSEQLEAKRQRERQLAIKAKELRRKDVRPTILRPKKSQKERELEEAKRKEMKVAEEKRRRELELAEAKRREESEAARRRELETAEEKRKEQKLAEAKRRQAILEKAQVKRLERQVVEAKRRKDKEMADVEWHKKVFRLMEEKYRKDLMMKEEKHSKELEILRLKHTKELAEAEAKRNEMKEEYEKQLQSLDLACGTLQRALDSGVEPTKDMGKLATTLIKDMLEKSGDKIELATGGPKFVLKKTRVPRVPSNLASERTVRSRNHLVLQDLCQLSSPDGKDTQAVIHQLKSLLQGRSTTEIQKYSKEQLQELFYTNSSYAQYVTEEVVKKPRKKRKDDAGQSCSETPTSVSAPVITVEVNQVPNSTTVTHTSVKKPRRVKRKSDAEQSCSETPTSVSAPVITVEVNQVPNSTTVTHTSVVPTVTVHTSTAKQVHVQSSTPAPTTSMPTDTSQATSCVQAQQTLTHTNTRTYTVNYPFPHCNIHPPTSKSIAEQCHPIRT
ncbi:uncharacterized protein [Amphiura filiformis]|uniref:uncharacterized protein n=1 Tax=Amphiura filiformis TaxID=82378 RepID=UPI003B21721D